MKSFSTSARGNPVSPRSAAPRARTLPAAWVRARASRAGMSLAGASRARAGASRAGAEQDMRILTFQVRCVPGRAGRPYFTACRGPYFSAAFRDRVPGAAGRSGSTVFSRPDAAQCHVDDVLDEPVVQWRVPVQQPVIKRAVKDVECHLDLGVRGDFAPVDGTAEDRPGLVPA